ncbi:MAG: tryptophan synthase subunit alpha [Gemmatimonadota bacterium]
MSTSSKPGVERSARRTRAARAAIGGRFARARAEQRAALIPYITAGYPDPGATLPLMRALEEAGADVIELGIPFSDPLADGPTIQRTSQQALASGAGVESALETLSEYAAEGDCPVVLFTYLNPLLGYGPGAFVRDASAAGAAGLLLTDLPLGADPVLEAEFEASALDLVRLVAPTTPSERAAAIARRAQGFLYYVSRTGVTGARADLPPEVESAVASLKARADVPVAVGFGISTPAQARAVGRVADGVVVGSALLETLADGGIPAAASMVAELRSALDRVAQPPSPGDG